MGVAFCGPGKKEKTAISRKKRILLTIVASSYWTKPDF
jgi:hypothetical protein